LYYYRFSSVDFKNELPNWIKDNLEIVDKFGQMIAKVHAFFKNKNKNPMLNRLLNRATL
jgi:hypothetical protein